MTITELIRSLESAVATGRVDMDDEVLFRDHRISDEAMAAGSNGYTEVNETLLIPSDNREGLTAGIYLLGVDD
ncbi:hypothetical protein PBI_TEAMOCIL_67 [Microbacterium phage Teamocil]|uniref:Uncharacterized protein n=1 Tax=Microbacterium phage Teamocil TaxID=2656554 RepID=A0A649VYG2_9CAUD|nr:hypothetical protein QDA12_gp67 [Microbacterium phage Teamocil]QGJ88918.1 hypothetical protein PBI_GINA_67 [Microbacterium phage Gina]QGJ97015.1 hypothetical protein PBI_TEAMOCIL_67 [Microbacterium phage Teamocil]